MRCTVPSSTVGLGDVETSARWVGAGLAATAVGAGLAATGGATGLVAFAAGALAFGGVGACAKTGAARMMAAKSVGGTSRIACVTGVPLNRHHVDRPASAQRHAAASSQCLKLQVLS